MKQLLQSGILVILFSSFLLSGSIPGFASTNQQLALEYYQKAMVMREKEKKKTGYSFCKEGCPELFHKSAVLGFAKAQYIVSIKLAAQTSRHLTYSSNAEYYKPVKRKATKWLLDAVNKGDSDAKYLLGIVKLQLCNIHEGFDIVPNRQQGKRLIEKAAISGNHVAQFLLSFAYFYGTWENYTKEIAANTFLRKQPELQDYLDGDSHLLYSEGRAIFIESVSNMIQPFELNVKQLLNGISVKKDTHKALHWLEKAAENELTNAQYELGRLYLLDQLVQKDDKKAHYWFKRAIDRKNKQRGNGEYYYRAAFRLAEQYRQGKGVETDRLLAKKYYLEMSNSLDIDLLLAGKAKYNFGKFLETEWRDPHHRKLAKFLIFQAAFYQNRKAIEWTEKKAKKGDKVAQMAMAEIARGRNLLDLSIWAVNLLKKTRPKTSNPDYKRAFEWYQQSANQGFAPAQFELALMYDTGTGISQDFKKAEYWYLKAAKQGYRHAYHNLGIMYLNKEEHGYADSTISDEEYDEYLKMKPKAVEFLKIAAQKGEIESFKAGSWLFRCQREPRENDEERILNPCTRRFSYSKSLYQLAGIYERDDILKKDLTKSHELYQKAADLGFPKAYGDLAYNYYFGRGTAKDYKKAYFWATKTEFTGPLSHLVLGWMYQNGRGVDRNYKSAIHHFKIGVFKQNARAGFELGNAYLKGIGVKQDDVEAVKWFTKAAELGDRESRQFLYNILNLRYLKDPEPINRWIIPCAKANITRAEYTLAKIYDEGIVLKKDDEKAFYWYSKAAEKNHVDAMEKLAFYHEFGRSAPVDIKKALSWYEKSVQYAEERNKNRLTRRVEFLKSYISKLNSTKDNDIKKLPTNGSASINLVSQIVDSEIKKIVFSPSGEYFVTIGKGDHQILIWNYQSGHIVNRLNGHTAEINDIVISENQRYLVSAGEDKKIIIWDFYTGKKVSILTGHHAAINDLEMNSKGNYLISAGSDTYMGIWNFPSGKLHGMIKSGQTGIHSVAVSPDEHYLLTSSRLELANLRTFPDGKLLYADRPKRFSDKGKSFYQGILSWKNKKDEINFIQGYQGVGKYRDTKSHVKCWSIQPGDNQKKECDSYFSNGSWYDSKYANSLSLGNFGKYFVFNTKKSTLVIADGINGTILKEIPFEKNKGRTTALGVGPKEKLVLAAYEDGRLRSYRLRDGQLLREIKPVTNSIERISFSNTNHGIVIQNKQGDLFEIPFHTFKQNESVANRKIKPLKYASKHKDILDMCQNKLSDCLNVLDKLVKRLKPRGENIKDAITKKIFITPKLDYYFLHGNRGSLQVVKPGQSSDETKVIPNLGNQVLNLIYTNGSIHSFNTNGTIFKWDFETGKPIAGWRVHNRTVGAMATDQAGRYLLTGGSLSLKIWDLHQSDILSQAFLREWQQIKDVRDIIVSSDDKFALILSGYHHLFILDLSSGYILHRIQIDPRIKNFDISPDGKTLAVATADSTIMNYDVFSGEKLTTLYLDSDQVEQYDEKATEGQGQLSHLVMSSRNLSPTPMSNYWDQRAQIKTVAADFEPDKSLFTASSPCISLNDSYKFPLIAINQADFKPVFSKLADMQFIDDTIKALFQCKKMSEQAVETLQIKVQKLKKQIQSCKAETCNLKNLRRSLKGIRQNISQEKARSVFHKLVTFSGEDSPVNELKSRIAETLAEIVQKQSYQFTSVIPSHLQIVPFVNVSGDLNALFLVSASVQHQQAN